MQPLPDRHLCRDARAGHGLILRDCGEGTQIPLRGWGLRHLSTILLTHMRADHVLGLPGLLLTLANPRKGNGESLTIYGPQPLQWLALRSFLLNSVEPAIRAMALALALGSWSVAAALLPTLAGVLPDRGLVQWPLILGCYGAAPL